MASEEELRKINVRSPYFVNVTKPVSDGGVESDDTGGGEEPFEEPTEPTVTTTTISCGDTRNIGVQTGIYRYEISTVGKQIGDYNIDFTGITVPFYAKIGIKGNMPADYTFMAGWINSDTVWLNSVGTPTPSSTTIATNPDGNDQTITYTSTQSDIDTYGETVVLEIFHPIIHLASVNFAVDCPNAVVSLAEDSGQHSVFIMTIGRGTIPDEHLSSVTNKFNGQDADWLTFPDRSEYKSFVFGNYTPALEPVVKDYAKHLNSIDLVNWDDARHTVVYRPSSDLNRYTNTIEFKQRIGDSNQFNGAYKIWISRHRIETVTDATRTNDEAFATYRNIPVGQVNVQLVSRLNQEGMLLDGLGERIYYSGFDSSQTFNINFKGTDEGPTTLEINHLVRSSLKIKSFDRFGNILNDREFSLDATDDDQNISIYNEN
ncbi:MAG TPA: hypothetical protein DCX01_04195 [Bacteroidetes bacterium]|nr:hypothetical protein [Bacteroidota bacterium]